MGKKTFDDDVRFEDINFDSDLDVTGGGYDPKPKSGKRVVITEASKSFLGDVSKSLTDRTFARRWLGLMMPKGYSQLFNAYDGTVNTINKIYGENEAELRPYMAKANRLLSQRAGRFKNVLPKSLREALDQAESSQKRSDKFSSSSDDELNAGLKGIEDLFRLEVSNSAEQRIEERRKELKEDKKFRLSLMNTENVAAGIGRLVGYQDKILINYHRKSLEINFRQFDVQRRLFLTTEAFHKDAIDRLDAIQKNSAMPDYLKLTHSEALKNRLREKLAEAAVGGLSKFRGDYFSGISKMLSGSVKGFLSNASMVSGLMPGDDGGMGMDKRELYGSMAGSMLAQSVIPSVQRGAEHVADILSPIVAKVPGVKNTGDKLRTFLTDIPGALNRYRLSNDEDTGVKGFIGSMIKNLLPGYTPKDKIDGKSVDDLQDAAIFDNFVYNSITQVMPSYLESIDRTLRTLATGEEQEGQAWSHYTGSMVSRSTLDSQHLRIGLFRGQGANIRQEVQDLIGKMGGEILSQPARTVLAKRLLVDMQKGQGFRASDYVKPDAWADSDEATSKELIDFFMEKFNIGIDGKPLSSDISFQADILEAFTDSSSRIPKVLERAQVLMDAGVVGRDVLRRLGITEFGGMDHDFVNNERWTEIALGTDPFDVKNTDIGKKKETDNRSFKERLSDLPNEHRKKVEEQEENERRERERQRGAGRFDVIDTVQGPLGAIKKINPKIVYNQTYDIHNQPSSNEDSTPVGDIGTHVRLDKIFEKLNNLNVSVSGQGAGPAGGDSRLGNLAVDIVESGIDKGRKFGRFAKAKYGTARGKAKELIEQAEKFYKEDPRVRKVLDTLEQQYGKITDPERRAMLIQEIYKRTGTPEEITAYFKGKFEEAKAFFSEKAKEGSEWAGKKYDASRDLIMSIYEDRHKHMNDAKERITGTLNSAKAKMQDAYKNRDRVLDPLKGAASRAGQWMDNISGIRFADKGTHRRLDVANKLLLASLRQQGFSGDIKDLELVAGDDDDDKSGGTGFFKKSIGLLGKMGVGLAKYFKFTYGMIGKGIGLAAKGAKGVFKEFYLNPKYGVRDVHIEGEEEPRLLASQIKKGRYTDAKTGKVISSLKDITGEVVDSENGQIVITQEEFDNNKLVDGKGVSLARWLGGKALNIAGKAAGLAVSYVGGAYGVMGKMAVGAFKLAKNILQDQLTQFDAYFPGDEKPRIRSKDMAKGMYRDKDGKVITSLDQITGPVYDIDGNEIISQEEIDKYGSLYTRNGSLLFTFGRGMISAGQFALRTAGKAAKAYFGFIKKVGMGAMKLAGNIASRILGKRKAGGGLGSDDGLSEDILFEQLRIQTEILKTMKARSQGVAGDEDGDGDRDNSWADIVQKRAARNARGPNAAVVEAIQSLGDRLDQNFENLNEGIKEGKSGGILDKLKGFGGSMLGKIGLGGLAEKLAGKGILGGTRVLAGAALKGTFFAAKAAVTKVAVPLAIGAVKLGAAALSAIGLPAVLAAVAIGFVAYKGYQYYKNSKFDKKPLYFLRMMQYGVSPSDEKRVEAILQLETLLAPAVKDLDSFSPSFDTNKIDMRKIYEIFGLLKTPAEGEEPEDPSTVDQAKAAKLVNWMARRFQPVYLRHLSALARFGKVKDLNLADEVIKSKMQLHQFLDNVNIPGAKEVYNDLENTPFTGGWFSSGDLTEDNDDVSKAFARIRKIADASKESAPQATTESSVPDTEVKTDATTAAAAGATAAVTSTASNEPVVRTPTSDNSSESIAPVVTSTTEVIAPNPDANIPMNPAVTQQLVKRDEIASVTDLTRSLSVGSTLLQKAVDQLGSIDKTLKEINKGVNDLPNRMSAPQAMTTESTPLKDMTGDQLKMQPDQIFDKRPQRGNGSTRRQLMEV